MLKRILFLGALAAYAPVALADAASDCKQIEDRDLTIKGCTELIANNPQDAKAYTSRGHVYLAKGEFDRALADYTKAIEIDPKYAQAYSNRGYALLAKGEQASAVADFNKAIESYSEAIERDPANAEAFIGRGSACEIKGDYTCAISDATKAIDLDPKFALAYMNRGISYDAKGDHDGSVWTRGEIDPPARRERRLPLRLGRRLVREGTHRVGRRGRAMLRRRHLEDPAIDPPEAFDGVGRHRRA